jgi:transposase
MRRERRNHTSNFRARVALVTLKEDKTLAELAEQFDVRPNQITHWKKQLIGNAENIFGKGSKLAEDSEHKIQELQSKIGQLTIENDLLEQGLTRIHDLRGKGW